jgi:hypothetical protein
MQRFSIFLLCMICLDATAGVNLPVVDVSNGTVSARAAFGEEIVPQNKVSVAPLKKKVAKKVVARNAKKQADKPITVARTTNNVDVLNPHRPSSDLWANNEAPLRMPRMEEISVIRSDALLPEENLNSSPVLFAENNIDGFDNNVSKNDTLAQIDVLRKEIAQLTERQKRSEEKIASVRPVVVRTPVSGESMVKPAEKINTESKPEPIQAARNDVVENISPVSENNDMRVVNVRREIVPMETNKDVVMRSLKTKAAEPQIVAHDDNMSKMSPNELKKAFKKTYLSENKHLSTYRVDERFDMASDMDTEIEGFTAQRDLSEMSSGIRNLEIKISFMNGDSGLSRENYKLLSETASIVVNNPKRAIQIAIPESVTYTKDGRKLAARRLAIVEQVLRDTGVAEQRIVPVLSQRDEDVFVLRVISGDVFETLTKQKRNIFGDNVSKKTYKSMTW